MTESPSAEIVRTLIECMTAGRYAEAADLYDDDARIEVMLALPEPRIVEGRDLKARLRAATAPRSPMYADISCDNLRISTANGGETVFAEWRYTSRVPGRPEPVVNENAIAVVVRNGRIVESRDYHNHVMRAVADGAAGELIETIRRLA